MLIYSIDLKNGITDIIENFESVIWNVQYFDRSDFQLVTSGDNDNIKKLKVGTMLVRENDITGNQYNNIMVIESQKLEYDQDKGWVLTVTGKGLKNILSRRIVWNQMTFTGVVEKAIRQIIKDNVIAPEDDARKIPDFVLDAEQGFTDVTNIQLFGDNIAEWLVSVCQLFGYGWDVYVKDRKYVFRLYKGTDRSYNQSLVPPVVFSPEFDNLLSSTYTYSLQDYKNAALIGGEGEGTAKRTTGIGTASGLERYETFIDGSGVSSDGQIITAEQYTDMLKDYGQTQLTNTAFNEKFEGEIEAQGTYVINRDFFLGDVVQIVNEKGISATPRIIEIIYAEDENGTSVVPTFSEWEVN